MRPHVRFVSEVKAPQPKEFGDIAIAELEAQPTIEHLDNNIGGHLNMIMGYPSAH